MDKTDPYDITRAIVALNPWERASRHNWALVPQTSAEPFIVTAVDERKDPGPVAGRLLLFPGFTTFRDFVITRQMKDYGVAMGPMDFRHYEAVGLKNGDVEIFVYEPGYVPVAPTSEDRKLLAPLLHECYALLLRVEEKPDLPLAYVEKKAMFARKEVVDGVWIDGPFILPAEEVIQLRAEESLRRFLQGCRIPALAAESQVCHQAGLFKHLDAAVGEPLRRADRPGQGQLQHQVHAALHGGPGTGVLPHDGKIPPLDKVAAHDAHESGIRPQACPHLLQQVGMAVVHGIVFYNDTSDLHRFHP